MLDPDPYEINTDPKHWIKVYGTWVVCDQSMIEWSDEGARRLAQVNAPELLLPGSRTQAEGVKTLVELLPGLQRI